MFVLYKLNRNDNVNNNFEELFKEALIFLVAKKKFISLVHIKKKC